MQRALPVLRRLGLETAFPLGLILLIGILCSCFRNEDFFFVLGGGFLLLVYVVFLLWRVLAAAWKKYWPNAGMILAGIGLTVLLAWPVMMAGDYIHLALMYPSYENRIAAAHTDRMSFYWGGDGFSGVGTTDYFLVYDRLNAIRKEPAVQKNFRWIEISGRGAASDRQLLSAHDLLSVSAASFWRPSGAC